MARKPPRKAAKAKSAPRSVKATTRTRILALLGREREVWNRKTQTRERKPPTMAQLAKEIKVHVRTLQRWKNSGVEPRRKTRKETARVQRLVKAARSASSATERELRQDRKRHPKAVRITKRDLPVMPAGHRRMLKRYERDARNRIRATGEEYESGWVNYAVHGWRFRELAALVVKIWKQKHAFQFIYEVPAGGQLPKSGDKPPRRVRKTTRQATAPINPYAFDSQEELLGFLNQYIDYEQGTLSRRMLYIAVDDNKPERRGNDDEGDDE